MIQQETKKYAILENWIPPFIFSLKTLGFLKRKKATQVYYIHRVLNQDNSSLTMEDFVIETSRKIIRVVLRRIKGLS